MDEFIVALGPCDDGTEETLRQIADSKIRIIPTQWNPNMRGDANGELPAFVCGQQRSIALFNCTGDWAFYLDADELIHENELPKIRGAMENYLNDAEVEALVFNYLHFYGNANTYGWSPRWYRAAARIVRNTIPYWTPKGMGFVILESQKRGRWPRAAHTGATIYHYGWVRSKEVMDLKVNEVRKFGRTQAHVPDDYAQVDPLTLREFTGTHPKAVQSWLPPANGIFKADPNHRLTSREKKHRLMLRLEQLLGIEFNKKHYRIVR